MDLEALQLLKKRTDEANRILEGVSQYARPMDGNMQSRAQFLQREIADLSAVTSKPIPEKRSDSKPKAAPALPAHEDPRIEAVLRAATPAALERTLSQEFPLTGQGHGSFMAQFRSNQLKLERVLKEETDEARAAVILRHIEKLQGSIDDQERIEAIAKSTDPQVLTRHNVTVVREDGTSTHYGKPSRSYRSIFGQPQFEDESFRSLSDMAKTIQAGQLPDRLVRAAHAASTLVGADGGFLIPPQHVVEVIDSAVEQSIMLSRGDVIPMINGSALISGFDGSNRENGSIYGFSAQWLNEGEEMNLQKAKYKQLAMKAKKLGILTAATIELLHDSSGRDGVSEALAKAIAFNLDRALLFSGQGTTAPLSLFNSAAKIVVSKEVGQSNDTLTYKNLTAMMAKLLPECERNAIWIASPSVRPALMECSIILIEDVAASFVPVLSREGSKDLLLGREIVWSEHLPALGESGDIMLADLSLYGVGLSQNMSIDRSDHVFYKSGEVAFRAFIRLDGMNKLTSAITTSNGQVLSSIIALETR